MCVASPQGKKIGQSLLSGQSEMEEPLPVSKDQSKMEEPLPATEDQSEMEEPLPVSKDQSEMEEPLPVTEDQSKKEEPLPVSKNQSKMEEPLPATEDQSEMEEPLPVSKDQSEMEGPLPVVEDPKSNDLFHFHHSLKLPVSAHFDWRGGVLYSSLYGVRVHVPEGAIGKGELVKISFELVTDLRDLLSNEGFSHAVLCSEVFNFEATDVPSGKSVEQFEKEVWIEFPHYAHLRNSGDVQSVYVLSNRGGSVRRQDGAVFSIGYPYVNLPLLHFSPYCTVQERRRKFLRSRLSSLERGTRSLKRNPSHQSSFEKSVSLKNSPISLKRQDAITGNVRRSNLHEKVHSDQSQSSCGSVCSEAEEMECDTSCHSNNVTYNGATDSNMECNAGPVPLDMQACVLQPKERHGSGQAWSGKIYLLPHSPHLSSVRQVALCY